MTNSPDVEAAEAVSRLAARYRDLRTTYNGLRRRLERIETLREDPNQPPFPKTSAEELLPGDAVLVVPKATAALPYSSIVERYDEANGEVRYVFGTFDRRAEADFYLVRRG